MAGAESTVDLWTAQELNLGGTGAVAPPSPEVFNSVEKFLDSSYSYFSGYTDEGWKVNRWDVDAVKSVSTGTGEKPDTLAECQALSYS